MICVLLLLVLLVLLVLSLLLFLLLRAAEDNVATGASTTAMGSNYPQVSAGQPDRCADSVVPRPDVAGCMCSTRTATARRMFKTFITPTTRRTWVSLAGRLPHNSCARGKTAAVVQSVTLSVGGSVWGNDREMMTSDAGGGVYAGFVKLQTDPLAVHLARPAEGTQPGGAMCVLSGTGAL